MIDSEASGSVELADLSHHAGAELFNRAHEDIELLVDTFLNPELVLDDTIQALSISLLILQNIECLLHLSLNFFKQVFNLFISTMDNDLFVLGVINESSENNTAEFLKSIVL